jgi:FkbM family methyltransferase
LRQWLYLLLRTKPFARKCRNFIINIRNFNVSPQSSIIRVISMFPDIVIFDIGANVGQFGIDLRSQGFKGKIFSFEPTSKALDSLSEIAKKFQPWEVSSFGLGSFEGEKVINVSGNAALSSSFLDMEPIHKTHFPESSYIYQEKVAISTIDAQIKSLDLDPRKVLLKIDVQGYEYEVLEGARNSLSKIPFCYLEVSLVPLYTGQLTLLSVLNLLADSGHQVIDVFRGIQSSDGELLQLDILTRLIGS